MSHSSAKPPENGDPDLPLTNPSGQTKMAGKRTIRRGLRFGLRELLLMTAAIAAWIPAILARREIPQLEADIQMMRQATLELIVQNPSVLNIRALPSVWQNIEAWKYQTPPEAGLELRLATEGINSTGFPVHYEAIPLPEGQHSICLKTTNDQDGFHHVVYLDGEAALQKHHPPSWLESVTSSSQTDVYDKSETFHLDQVVTLLREQSPPKHPLLKFETTAVEPQQDKKGVVLWISPHELSVQPPPQFIASAGRGVQWTIGHRQGIRVRSSTEKDAVGVLDIQPSAHSVFGETLWNKETRFGVSVRPVVQLASGAETPEVQSGLKGPTPAPIPFTLEAEFTRPLQVTGKLSGKMNTEQWLQRSVSDDGSKMRLFAHYQPFPSGAQPIVEILFDANHPDRIGFLPHTAPGSTPMQACEFVTRFDARFFWRKVLLSAAQHTQSSSDSSNIPLDVLLLSQLKPAPNSAFEPLSQNATTAELPWLGVPFNRLPLSHLPSDPSGSRKLTLRTDVKNATKLNFPIQISSRWQYQGIPNRQVWWLPTGSKANSDESTIKVHLRPTDFFPTTQFPLPGGQAIGNVRIIIPMPTTQPVWLAIEADATLLN
jgi:hypothetical protein